MRRLFRSALMAAGTAGFLSASAALAERISQPIALFEGLNKITGIATNFEAPVGQEVQFDTFLLKAFVCYTRPITEEPKTVAFVQIDNTKPDGSKVRAFSGWMFAESPGLNGVEHPILDVWLTGCRDPNAPPPPVETPPQREADDEKKETADPLD